MLVCIFAIPLFAVAQNVSQNTNSVPQSQEQTGQNVQRKKPATKVFMPNKNYKRISHTGQELPTPRKSEFSPAASNSTTSLSPDAKLTAVAPKYRQNTQQLIVSIQSKLDYLKTMENTPEIRLQIIQLEQQLVTAYQQLSFEKECNSQH